MHPHRPARPFRSLLAALLILVGSTPTRADPAPAVDPGPAAEAKFKELQNALFQGNGPLALQRCRELDLIAKGLPPAQQVQVAIAHCQAALSVSGALQARGAAEAGLVVARALAPPDPGKLAALLDMLASACHQLLDYGAARAARAELQAVLDAAGAKDSEDSMGNLLVLHQLATRVGDPGAKALCDRLRAGPAGSDAVRRFKAREAMKLPLRRFDLPGGSPVLMDAAGRPVAGPYSYLKELAGGFFEIVDQGSAGLLDPQGLPLVPRGLNRVRQAAGNPAVFLVERKTSAGSNPLFAMAEDQKASWYGVIDGAGRILVPCEYPSLQLRDDGWTWGTAADGGAVWLDPAGKPADQAAFDASRKPGPGDWPAGYQVTYAEGGSALEGPGGKVVVAMGKPRISYLDEGRVLLTRPVQGQASPKPGRKTEHRNELALVELETGRILVDYDRGLDAVDRFRDGVAPARVDDRWGLIDRAGAFAAEPDWLQYGTPADGLMPVKLAVPPAVAGRDWTYVDRQGKPAMAARFAFAEPFQGGRARARVPADPRYLIGLGNGKGAPAERVDARDREIDPKGLPHPDAAAIPAFGGEAVLRIADQGWGLTAWGPGVLRLARSATMEVGTLVPRRAEEAIVDLAVAPKAGGTTPEKLIAAVMVLAATMPPEVALVPAGSGELAVAGRKWTRSSFTKKQGEAGTYVVVATLKGHERVYSLALVGDLGERARLDEAFGKLLANLELPFEK